MSFIYAKAEEEFWRGTIDLENDDIRAIPLDADYVPDEMSDEFLDIIPGGARLDPAVALTGISISSSGEHVTFDADDVDWPTVADLQSVAAFVIVRYDGGADNARRLLYYCDRGFGLVLATNGNTVTCIFPASGIFRRRIG